MENEKKRRKITDELRLEKHFRILGQLNGCDLILSIYFNEF